LIEAMSNPTFTQVEANTEEAVKNRLAALINSLSGMSATGITVTAADITLTGFTAAVAGDESNPSGTNGGFTFGVALEKGISSWSTASKTGVITATTYVPPATYTVTVASLLNGAVTVTPATPSVSGTPITLDITPDANYELEAISAHKTGDVGTSVSMSGSGAIRTFNMPAHDVTINASFRKTQAQLDKEAVDAAKAAIEGGTYKVTQASANDEVSVKTWLEETLNMLFGQSHDVQFRSATSIVGDVTITAITPAIEGTESNPNGTDGSFAFTVSLNKGATTLTTIATAGVIVATPHIPTDLNSLQVKSLKAYVQQGILNVSGLSAGKSWSVWRGNNNPCRRYRSESSCAFIQ
jgi:anti-sigma28 factor (negative regulator of flagellin synthesis)